MSICERHLQSSGSTFNTSMEDILGQDVHMSVKYLVNLTLRLGCVCSHTASVDKIISMPIIIVGSL